MGEVQKTMAALNLTKCVLCVVLCVSMVISVGAEFVLSFGNPTPAAPTTPRPTLPGGFDPACKDKISNCATYQQSSCTDPKFRPWALENCRAYCRECTASQLAVIDAAKTTLPPTQCVDKVECSRYGQDACNPAVYGTWGEENCALYCGFCTGVPTPPTPCMDVNSNCAGYQSDICTNPDYDQWVGDNCRKFCGIC